MDEKQFEKYIPDLRRFCPPKKNYRHRLSLAQIISFVDIKLMLEKKISNVATKYFLNYMGFFTFRRNWRVEHGRYPSNRRNAECLLEQLLAHKVILSLPEMERIELDLPNPSGRACRQFVLRLRAEYGL